MFPPSLALELLNPGFNLYSSRRIPAGDRQGLEILLHYLERPPISLSRLTYRDDGMVHSATVADKIL